MSTTSNTIFTGTSRFTNDFQQVITRSVAIASLPISQLNNQKNALSDQASAVSSLQSKFASLETALTNLGTATGLSSLNTAVSDASIARVSLTATASPASYSLEVQSLGSFTNALSTGSLNTVSDPASQNLSSASSFTINVGGTSTRIVPPQNTLSSLVSTLNNTAGLNVQASLVNVGSTGSPDYRLSVQSTKLGAVAIQVNDGTSDLLNNISTGALATYKINGLSTPISSDSRTVTLAPGVTAELTGQSAAGVATNINVTRQTGAIGNALSSLVSSYNAVADELDHHRGKAGGALTGNSIIQELGNRLRALGNYTGGAGKLSALTSLGVTFDGKGHLSYDAAAFTSATANNLPALVTFLGSSSSGFLQSAKASLASVDNLSTGILTISSKAFEKRISAQQDLIDTNQARVDRLKTNLQAQLAKADAQVAALEQSYSVLSGIYQAQQNINQTK